MPRHAIDRSRSRRVAARARLYVVQLVLAIAAVGFLFALWLIVARIVLGVAP